MTLITLTSACVNVQMISQKSVNWENQNIVFDIPCEKDLTDKNWKPLEQDLYSK